MKEIKIKEKWLYGAMDNQMDREFGVELTLSVLSDSLRKVVKERTRIWSEIYKRYKLNPNKIYYYNKKTHGLRETFDKNAEAPWLKKERLDKV